MLFVVGWLAITCPSLLLPSLPVPHTHNNFTNERHSGKHCISSLRAMVKGKSEGDRNRSYTQTEKKKRSDQIDITGMKGG